MARKEDDFGEAEEDAEEGEGEDNGVESVEGEVSFSVLNMTARACSEGNVRDDDGAVHGRGGGGVREYDGGAVGVDVAQAVGGDVGGVGSAGGSVDSDGVAREQVDADGGGGDVDAHEGDLDEPEGDQDALVPGAAVAVFDVCHFGGGERLIL